MLTLEQRRKRNKEIMRKNRLDPVYKKLEAQRSYEYRERQKKLLGNSYTKITTEKARDYLNSEKGKKWKLSYKEKNKENSRLRYSKDPDLYKSYTHKWVKNNPERVKELNKKYYKRRRHDPVLNLVCRIRCSIRRSLMIAGILKSGKKLKLLPYTGEEVAGHLSNFLEKPCLVCEKVILNLKNSHIDHILPVVLCKTFEDVIKLNSLENLRMVCRLCNLSKNSKIYIDGKFTRAIRGLKYD